MRRCPSCGEENSDWARFCQNCATPLAEPQPAAETRKVVTIVFADVSGSTALGERLDPEALRRVMERYFDEMAAVIARHGGTVEKFIGDAVMAVFGVPRLHEDDPLRAVRAAAEMREALRALSADFERDHGVSLAARVGVNTGEVVAGDPTAGQRLVTGDAVNVAARLEQAASPGEILLGDSTYRLVRDAVDAGAAGALDLKGKTDAVLATDSLRMEALTNGPRTCRGMKAADRDGVPLARHPERKDEMMRHRTSRRRLRLASRVVIPAARRDMAVNRSTPGG
jgi:class 3 adenylate cyclase